MRRALWIGLISTGLLSGCQLGPNSTKITAQPAAEMPTPVLVAAALIPETRTGPKVNQWGGIIPDAQPTVPVDDGGLGEIK